MPPFRILEHTADAGIEARGRTEPEALAEAALGLVVLVTGREPHGLQGARQEEAFAVEAPDHPALAVAFLSELLWLLESRDLLWAGGGLAIGTSEDGGLRLQAKANMLVYDPVLHGRGVEVKAVTYHGLETGLDRDGWRVRVYLDL